MSLFRGLAEGTMAPITSAFPRFPLWFENLGNYYWFGFLPEQLPETFRHWMLYNPIMHVVMLFRMGFYPDYKGEFLDMPYLLATVGISVALGMALMKVCARRVLSPL